MLAIDSTSGLEEVCNTLQPSVSRVVVVLGSQMRNNVRVATFMDNLIRLPAIRNRHGSVEVVPVTDATQALKVWKDSNFLPVAAFFASDADYDQLYEIIEQADAHHFSQVYRMNPTLLELSSVQRELTRTFNNALDAHNKGLSSFSAQFFEAADGATIEHMLDSYDDLLTLQIGMHPEMLSLWTQLYVDSASEKSFQPVIDISPRYRRPRTYQISYNDLESIIGRIQELLPELPLRSSELVRSIAPNDPRFAARELSQLLRRLVNAEGAVTRFTSHATEGVTGLFGPDSTFEPGEAQWWTKIYRSLSEAEDVFRRHAEFRQRHIEVAHQPLVVAPTGDGRYVLLSEAPVVTMTGDAVKILAAEDPELAERFVNAKIELGIDRLVQYKDFMGMRPNEAEMASILQGYKLKLHTVWKDIHLAHDTSFSHSSPAYNIALQLLDYRFNWPHFLFGSVMDWKVYNDGIDTGLLKPSAQQLRDFLLMRTNEANLKETNGTASPYASLRGNIADNQKLLEYDGRPGIVLEDFFHAVDAPEFAKFISGQRKIDYYERLLKRLTLPSLEYSLDTGQVSSLWLPYFVMETFKAARKVQRTFHYMASGSPAQYKEELQHYLQMMVGVPWVAHTFFNDTELSQGTDFGAQKKAIIQMYDSLDQLGKMEAPPSNVTSKRFAAWMRSNIHLLSIGYTPENLERLVVTS